MGLEDRHHSILRQILGRLSQALPFDGELPEFTAPVTLTRLSVLTPPIFRSHSSV